MAKAKFFEIYSEHAQQEDCKKEDAAVSEVNKSISDSSSKSDFADSEDQKRPAEYYPAAIDFQNKLNSNSL